MIAPENKIKGDKKMKKTKMNKKCVGAGDFSMPTSKDRQNNGITLIALIITIILMLILVSVTISMAINGGLFEYAGKATGETQNAIAKEQELASGKIKIGDTVYNSINEYLGNSTEPPNPTGGHSWTRGTGENIDVFTCSHCNKSYTMGDVVNYTDTGAASAEVTAARSGLDEYYAKKSQYPTDANADESGKQTITAENPTWIVLGIEDTNKDGKNETLLITTEEPVSGYYMYGAAAYNYAPSYYQNGNKVEGDIDRICKELYSNSEYGQARGMTIDDVNAALNYTPLGGVYFNNGYKTTGNFTTRLDQLPNWDDIKSNGTKTPDPNDSDTENDLGAYILNAYQYYLEGDTYTLTEDAAEENATEKTITLIERNTIFGTYFVFEDLDLEGFEFFYALASRAVDAGNAVADFGPSNVSMGRVEACNSWFCCSWETIGTQGELVSVRPVVSLTDKLPTVQ